MISEMITPRCLLGPGPSNVHPRVLQALAHPLVGHLDPQFVQLMQATQALLRYTFQTENELTIPISGTGSAGMEAALCNFIEPGDPVLICVNGYFGERLCNMAARYGAAVQRLDIPWGEAFSPNEIASALRRQRAKLVAIVHGETSTGVLQPLDQLAPVVHDHGALLLVDCVTTLGGVPLYIDQWGIDIAYSGTQKCLGVPPGLAPFTISPRAEQQLYARQGPVANWYLDLTMVRRYWGQERTYHHTAPISMNYALFEGLSMIQEEGLEACWARHRANAEYLWSELPKLGLDLVVPGERRLPSLTTVQVPVSLAEGAIRQRLAHEDGIEIGGGLGPFAGKVWRIGLMGYSSQKSNVDLLLRALQPLICP
jgi:alanine-glyoxylate transaminase / serine-glyoxylate transaminase / serine-pyruvate transaminase